MNTTLTWGDALKLAAAFLLAYVALQTAITLKGVFLIFFTAVIVAIAMDQMITTLEARGISRMVAAVVLYVSAGAFILGALSLIIPPLVTELRNVVEVSAVGSAVILPEDVERFDINPYIQAFSGSFADSPSVIFSTLIKTAGSVTTFLAIFFVAFFLTVQRGGVRSFVIPFLPEAHKARAMQFWDKLQYRVGNWLWGKTLSSLLVASMTFVGLWLFGVPYALSLALLAFILNYVPFVGPIIASLPAIVLGLSISPLTAVLVAMLYVVVNSIIEPFILGPIFMRKAFEVNPAFLILSVISGAYMGGVLGIIISIPVAAIVYLFVTEFWYPEQRKIRTL